MTSLSRKGYLVLDRCAHLLFHHVDSIFQLLGQEIIGFIYLLYCATVVISRGVRTAKGNCASYGCGQHVFGSGKVHFWDFRKRGEHSNFALALGGNSLVFEQESCAFLKHWSFEIVIELRGVVCDCQTNLGK